ASGASSGTYLSALLARSLADTCSTDCSTSASDWGAPFSIRLSSQRSELLQSHYSRGQSPAEPPLARFLGQAAATWRLIVSPRRATCSTVIVSGFESSHQRLWSQ